MKKPQDCGLKSKLGWVNHNVRITGLPISSTTLICRKGTGNMETIEARGFEPTRDPSLHNPKSEISSRDFDPKTSSGWLWITDNLSLMIGLDDNIIDLIYLDPRADSYENFEFGNVISQGFQGQLH